MERQRLMWKNSLPTAKTCCWKLRSRERFRSKSSVPELLQRISALGASDLFIIAGRPLSYRLNDQVVQDDSERLLPRRCLSYGICDPHKRRVPPIRDTLPVCGKWKNLHILPPCRPLPLQTADGCPRYAAAEEIITAPSNNFVKEFILNQLEIKRNNIFALFHQNLTNSVQAV